MIFSLAKVVQDFCARLAKIPLIVGSHRQPMRQGGGGDHAVFDRHGLSGRSKVGKKSSPAQAGRRVPRQAKQLAYSLFKPSFQPSSALSGRQEMNAKPDFSQDDRVYGTFALLTLE